MSTDGEWLGKRFGRIGEGSGKEQEVWISGKQKGALCIAILQ